MSLPSVDDSDVEEALSPPAEIQEIGNEAQYISPQTTRSADYADQFGIDPASPTRQLLQRSHSTTMDRLKKTRRMYGRNTTLDDLGINSAIADHDIANSVAKDEHTLPGGTERDDSGNSILSRDGDLVSYSNISISMSSPKFVKSPEMPPPGSLGHTQSSHRMAATQVMSDWGDNPLAALVGPPASDRLPSTRPSSEDIPANLSEPSFGTQDQIEIAFQLGEDILGEPSLENDVRAAAVADTAEDGSLADVAQPKRTTTRQSIQKQALHMPSKRKRTSEHDVEAGLLKRSRTKPREDIEENAELASPRSTKSKTQEVKLDEETFFGLAEEQYRPRKSRTRASGLDEALLASIDYGKRVEHRIKDKGSKVRRGKTVDDTIFIPTNIEDLSAGVTDDKEVIPGKTKSRRSKTLKDESDLDTLSPIKAESFKKQLRSSHIADTAKVMIASPPDDGSNHTVDREINSPANESRKKANSKKNRKTVARSRSLQTFSPDRQEDEHGIEDVKTEQPTSPKNVPEQKDLIEARSADEPSSQTVTVIAPKKLKKPKGKSGKAEGKAVVEDETPVDEVSEEVDEKTSMDVPQTDISESKETGESQHVPSTESQPLRDITNKAGSESSLKSTGKPSPLKPNRTMFRVGLSRTSRIEPLLKIVRKEKPPPKAVSKASKKKSNNSDNNKSDEPANE